MDSLGDKQNSRGQSGGQGRDGVWAGRPHWQSREVRKGSCVREAARQSLQHSLPCSPTESNPCCPHVHECDITLERGPSPNASSCKQALSYAQASPSPVHAGLFNWPMMVLCSEHRGCKLIHVCNSVVCRRQNLMAALPSSTSQTPSSSAVLLEPWLRVGLSFAWYLLTLWF